MTINEAYKFVKFVGNKNQRLNIKPYDFNFLAERAQIDRRWRIGHQVNAVKIFDR